jgi:tyrosine-specific transport protein
MTAYVAQGGSYLGQFLESMGFTQSLLPDGAGQALFAAASAGALFASSPGLVEKVNNIMVATLMIIFAGIVSLGTSTVNWNVLVDPAFQHPSEVANCFPILFLALVYQNIVPTLVTRLEGDRKKITASIIAGTTIPYLMFLTWNAVVLGNVLDAPDVDLSTMDPVLALQQQISSHSDGVVAALGPLVSIFSSLALITSVIGFTYGLVDAWTDVLNIDTNSNEFERNKPALFAAVFGPPLLLSIVDPDIFFNALDYGGAFGVSTLFLVLTPLLVWAERYGEHNKPLFARPMVPFGKIPLASMWKAAATLIVEQGAEKLGFFSFLQEHVAIFHSA